MSGSSSVLVAVALFATYLAVVGGLWRLNHVRYDALVDSRDTVLRAIVVPIGVGAVLLVVATTWLGWWQPVLFEADRSGPAWAIVVPVLFGVAALAGVAGIDWRSPRARRVLPILVVGVLLVGFAEELLTRGLLVVGARDSGWGPWLVFLLSTGLFALLHGLNALFGQSVQATVLQVGASFLAGSALYVTRLTAGTLILCMVLHAVWDFGTLGSVATDAKPRAVSVIAVLASYAAAVLAVPFVLAG